MIALPLTAPAARSPAERASRARALRIALGPPSGWSEDARADLVERAAIAEVDGAVDRAEAVIVAEDAVRAALLRRIP